MDIVNQTQNGEFKTINCGDSSATNLTSFVQGSLYGKEKQASMKRKVVINRAKKSDSLSSDSSNNSSAPAVNENVRFPRLKQFAHFHYDYADFDKIKAVIDVDETDYDDFYTIRVTVNKRTWMVRREYEHFKTLDKQLHACVFDRKISQLPDLSEYLASNIEEMNKTIIDYIDRLSQLSSGQQINCGTILNFFEVDNRGNRIVGINDSAINIPAIAAAQVIKRYISQSPDELSLEVNDMVSVIDKPAPEESTWWRGKKSFEVGFFPSECVEIIGGKPSTIKPADEDVVDTKPVLRRRGKLITFLRMFFSHRPTRTVLKQNGIVKERIFGCDLGEHLLNTSLTIPTVLKCCCEAIEEHGLIDGIYRLSGVASNIQKLRMEFDDGSINSLEDDEHLLDLHTITAVLKTYFRELPNPLLTYQLYDLFADAVQHKGNERLEQLKKTIQHLPPPHYRTAKHLFRHLNLMARYEKKTGMNSKNLAIVWSPNLMRSKAMETSNISGPTMLYNVSVQATVVEALITHFEYVFSEDPLVTQPDELKLQSSPMSCNWANDKPVYDIPDQAYMYSELFDEVDGPVLPHADSSSDSIYEAVTMQPTRPDSLSLNADSLSLDAIRSSLRWRKVFKLNKKPRPSSVAVSSPSRLLSLSEAQDRLSGDSIANSSENDDDIIPVFHTVIEFNDKKHCTGAKDGDKSQAPNTVKVGWGPAAAAKDRSPSSWKSFFNRGRPGSMKKTSQEKTVNNILHERTKSIESCDDITGSEIGHLRRSQASSSTSCLNKTCPQDNTADPVCDDSRPGDMETVQDETTNLIRAASHESFFDPSSPTSSSNEPDLTTSMPKTPGVVYRPAYKSQGVHELINTPKATWKVSSQTKTRTGYTPTDQPSKKTTHAYISPAISYSEEQVEPVQYSQSPGIQRRKYQTNLENQQVFSDNGEPIYEPASIPQQTVVGRPPVHPPVNKPSVTEESESITTSHNYELPSDIPSNEEMDKIIAGWGDAETILCMNQAQQAQLSRHFSVHSNSSDRSRRLLHDSVSSDNQTLTSSTSKIPESDEPIYANVDPLALKQNSPHEAKESTCQSVATAEDSSIHEMSDQPPGALYEKHRQASVPRYIQQSLSSDNLVSPRPRSNSSPYGVSPFPKRKETNIDEAIAKDQHCNNPPAVQSNVDDWSEYVNIDYLKSSRDQLHNAKPAESSDAQIGKNDAISNANAIPSSTLDDCQASRQTISSVPLSDNKISTTVENKQDKSNGSTTSKATNRPIVPRKPSKHSGSKPHQSKQEELAKHPPEPQVTEYHARLDVIYSCPDQDKDVDTIKDDKQQVVPENLQKKSEKPEPLPRKPLLNLL